MARNNTEWLNELGNSTKLVKPRFGVVVHRTLTENFDLENANARAIEKIIEENDLSGQGFRIEEVAWLKRKDKPLGKFASLRIWFDSTEGAEYILNNGLLSRREIYWQRGAPRDQEKEMLPVPAVRTLSVVVQGNTTVRLLCGPTRTATMPPRG